MDDKLQKRKERRNQQIQSAIDEIKKANNIRLVLDGKEFLHDFDQMEATAIQKVAVKILEEYLIK